MGNGYFSRSCSIKSHSVCSDRYLSAETEKGINVDCCRLNSNARRSGNFVENGLARYFTGGLGPFKSSRRNSKVI